jgi:hypothetical protein
MDLLGGRAYLGSRKAALRIDIECRNRPGDGELSGESGLSDDNPLK